MDRVRLIVGLGNPGAKYSDSRHNVGFKCIDLLARKWGIRLDDRRAKAALGQGRVDGHPVALAKPRTYMNNSGEGVEYLLTRFAAKPEDLVIIYDEMDLPLGKVRIRPGGSPAGHNGIKSIIAALSTQDFPRIRVGIGKPNEGTIGYVLGTFSPEEKPVIEEVYARVSDAVTCLIHENIQEAMNRFN
jgi:PTH1 family peptidyl-tRNA hydrolase